MFNSDLFIRSVVTKARSHIGVATYNRDATPVDAPHVFNCFSLMQWLWCPIIELPDHLLKCDSLVTIAQSDIITADFVFVPRRKFTLESDDFGHVGILSDSGTVIHATKWRNGIVEDSFESFIERGFLGARRVPLK